jgi:hypothetical protein
VVAIDQDRSVGCGMELGHKETALKEIKFMYVLLYYNHFTAMPIAEKV